VQLTASGEFEDALALCKLLPPEDSNLRAAKESSIHMRYVQIARSDGRNSIHFALSKSVDIYMSLHDMIG
jgi:hypothetical protein